MSTGFSKKFMEFVKGVIDSLGTKGKPDLFETKASKSALSASKILPGDVLFFSYTSKKFGSGEHLCMVMGNRRNKFGIFQHKGKLYLSAIKLNNTVTPVTTGLIVESYQEKRVQYKTKKQDTELEKKSLIALVGRNNYRTYIMNNITMAFEVEDKAKEY